VAPPASLIWRQFAYTRPPLRKDYFLFRSIFLEFPANGGKRNSQHNYGVKGGHQLIIKQGSGSSLKSHYIMEIRYA
jgi:hypothetical protein